MKKKNLTTDIFGSCQALLRPIMTGASPDKTHTNYYIT